MKTKNGKNVGTVLAAMLIAGVATVCAAGAQAPNADQAANQIPQIFHVNGGRSTVTFTAGEGDQALRGTFRIQSSAIHFIQDGGRITGQIVIAGKTEHSNRTGKDKTLRQQVLQTGQFPQMTFVPSHFEGELKREGDSTLQMTGVLTVLGKPHAITVPVSTHTNGFECTAKAVLQVPYTEWGMPDLSAVGIGGVSQVQVQLTMVGYLSPRN